MPETQKQIGHLDEPSSNPKPRGGPNVTQTQPHVGHLDEPSSNPKARGGSAPPPLTDRGYPDALDDVPTPTQVKPDGRIDGGY